MVAAVLLVLSVLGQPLATKASEPTCGPARGAFCLAAQTERKRLGALDAGASQLNSGRALKLLTFLVGQCHDDRIFIDAKELGRVVVGIAED